MGSVGPGIDASPAMGWANSSSLPTNNTDYPSEESSFYHEDYQRRVLIYNIKIGFTYACYGLTILLGTLGNVLVIYTIWCCRHLHTVMYTLLASLSVADLIMVVLILPWKMHLITYYGEWKYSDFMCRFSHFLYLLSSVASVFHLTIISLERCYAVTSPLKSRTVLTMGNAYRMVVAIWLVSVAASIPAILCSTASYINGNYLCRNNFPNTASRKAYSLYVFFTVFGIPMALIIVAYGIIFNTLRKRRMPSETPDAVPMSEARRYWVGQRSTNTDNASVASGTRKLNRNVTRNKEAEFKQMTIMLVIVVSLFAVSWGPKLILNILKNFEVLDAFGQLDISLELAFSLIASLNSAVNPIVYALVSPSFRGSCKWALQVCCKLRQVRRRPSGASRAMTVSRVGHTNGAGSVTYMDHVSVSSSACAADKM